MLDIILIILGTGVASYLLLYTLAVFVAHFSLKDMSDAYDAINNRIARQEDLLTDE